MPLSPLEKKVFFWLHGLDLQGLNQLMQFFSSFLPWFPLIGWLLWLGWRKFARRDFFRLVLLTVLMLALVDTSTSYFFKNLLQRLRPCKMAELKNLMADFGQGCGGRWGFFSSHAANAAALVHFLLYFTRPKKWQWVLAWSFVLLVGYSRIYLGVHLPLDILVGFAWGVMIASGWRWVGKMALKGPAVL